MANAFLSSKRGVLSKINLFRYDFTEDVLNDNNRKIKLITWIKRSGKFEYNTIDHTGFYTYGKIEVQKHQFNLVKKTALSTPYDNTQQVSKFISSSLKVVLEKGYKQFQNKNEYIVDQIDLYPVVLLKCFGFNIEVFKSGEFFIHFYPVSKIVSLDNPFNYSSLERIIKKNKNVSNTDRMQISLVDQKKYFRKRLDILDAHVEKYSKNILTENANFRATFDYHFVANFDPDLFGKVSKNSSKDLKESVWFLNDILSNIDLPLIFNLEKPNFYESLLLEPEIKNNLLVGSRAEAITIHSKNPTRYGLRIEFTRDNVSENEILHSFVKNDEESVKTINEQQLPIKTEGKVEFNEKHKSYKITFYFSEESKINTASVQSATFYNGVYQPANNFVILPIAIDLSSIELFENLLHRFNLGGKNYQLLPPTFISSNDELAFNNFENIKSTKIKNALVVFFCKYKMPKGFFDNVKRQKIKFQIYQGELLDKKEVRARLSNFTCKCLNKLGGIVTAFYKSGIDKNCYFIGIDLGHTTQNNEKYSNLAMVLFDNNGILLYKYKLEDLPRQEGLNKNHLITTLSKIANFLKGQNSSPQHLIFHRDGKVHINDVNYLLEAVDHLWGKIDVDIVEIIKMGYPVMVIKKNKSLLNPESGYSYQDEKNRYAILVTNTQVKKNNTVVNPIVIKHTYGKTGFRTIVDQVYWFSNLYTNNLYNPTTLPATTLKANNIVSTSKKEFRASYLG